MAIKTIMANGRSGAEIDLIALSIVKTFQPKVLQSPRPFDVEYFFELQLDKLTGVVGDYSSLPAGIYGVTDSVEMRSTVSADLIDDPRSEKFARSTIGHECGHAIIHVPEFKARRALLKSFQDNSGMRVYRREEIPTFRSPEWQADRFSAGLLMPEPMVKAAIRDGAETADHLGEMFNVSVPFVRSRLKSLRIVLKSEWGGIAVPPHSRFSGQRQW